MEKDNQILIIDDDADFANFVNDVAKTLKLNCIVTTNSMDFIKSYNSSVTLILMDLNIPNLDGIELLRFVEKMQFDTDIILMSGFDKRILESAQEFAISKGLSVIGHFQKPIHLKDLEELLKKSTIKKSTKKYEKPSIPKMEFILSQEELLHAIENNEFLVFYQPKIEIATAKLVGVEALIRWLHPEHGLISPDQFIHLAETSGLVDKINWVFIEKALKEIGSLKRKIGFTIMLSLNLSPYSLHDLELPDKLLALLNQSNISPQNIILEITETALLNEISSALDIFTRLRLKNFQLSIDDFGTGYAMIQQLKLIPATELKIDKLFIQDMLETESGIITVKKIIEMGHELGMKITAEGVETKEQLQALKNLQCDIVQGFFYSKPIPITELTLWINNQDQLIEI